MNHDAKHFLVAVAISVVTIANAHAVECLDPVWTRAITEAMDRAPKAGECNVNLYGKANTHEERVQAARKTLTVLYASRGSDTAATQKLPLHSVRNK